MKKLLSVFAVAIFLTATMLVSCKKTDNSSPHANLTVAQNKTNLEQTSSDLSTQMTTLQSAPGMTAATSIMNIGFPFSLKSGVVQTMNSVNALVKSKMDGTNLLTTKSVNLQVDAQFVFSEWIGIYTWSPTQNEWLKTSNSANTIIFKYPSTPTGSTNDATLTLYSYTEQLFGTSTYQPTSISLDIYIASVKQMSLNLTATYATNGQPTYLNIAYFVNPFIFSEVYTNSSVTVGSVTTSTVSETLSLLNSTTTILAVSTTVTGNLTDINNPTTNTVSGYIQMEDIKLSMNVDAKDLNAITNPTDAQYNQYIVMNIGYASDGVKIADFVYYTDPSTGGNFMLKFPDGTTSTAQVYFATAMTNLQTAFGKLGINL